MKKIDQIFATFSSGVKEQLRQEWTYGASLAVGLVQGLKYTGSLSRGIKSGVATLGAICVMNGIHNVAFYWDRMDEVEKR